MSTVQPSIPSHQGAPWTPATCSQRLSIRQSAIADEFCSSYGLKTDQIFFDGDSIEPLFEFDALALLANELGDFTDISVTPIGPLSIADLVTVCCKVTSARGFTRQNFGSCLVPSIVGPGRQIETVADGESVASGRALRKTLRLAGFDVMRAHLARGKGGAAGLDPIEPNRNNELAQIHVLAAECGLIKGTDKMDYYRVIGAFFPGVKTTRAMTEPQRATFISMLRAWLRAHEVATRLSGSQQSTDQ